MDSVLAQGLCTVNSLVTSTPGVSIFTLNICFLLLLSFSSDTKQINSRRQFYLMLIQDLSQLAWNMMLKAFPSYTQPAARGWNSISRLFSYIELF